MRTLDKEKLLTIEKYIIEYQSKHGMSPSYRKILQDTKMGSLNLVQRYVLALEREGRITRNKLGNIEMIPNLKPSESVTVHLVGSISCGTPMEAIENYDASFSLPKELFGDGELYMLKAFGTSMIEAGIEEGDRMIIRKQSYADDGDIVVAIMDGETTLKRLFRKNGKIVLHPENKTMEDIIVTECEVQGVLVGCIKTF